MIDKFRGRILWLPSIKLIAVCVFTRHHSLGQPTLFLAVSPKISLMKFNVVSRSVLTCFSSLKIVQHDCPRRQICLFPLRHSIRFACFPTAERRQCECIVSADNVWWNLLTLDSVDISNNSIKSVRICHDTCQRLADWVQPRMFSKEYRCFWHRKQPAGEEINLIMLNNDVPLISLNEPFHGWAALWRVRGVSIEMLIYEQRREKSISYVELDFLPQNRLMNEYGENRNRRK